MNLNDFSIGGIQNNILEFITPEIMWFAFLIITGITVILSLVVLWHWDKYAVGLLRKSATQSTYVMITGSLLFAVLISVVLYVS